MIKRGGRVRAGGCTVCVFMFSLIVGAALGELGPANVLLLVNSQSASSRYIARIYRSYYPSIADEQVVELSGLADCSGPAGTAADEIITRQTYNTCIAEPVRQHLLEHGLLGQIFVIITTAGMPYRIEDTNPALDNVIYPGGSSPTLVVSNESLVDAASVESELTCLWYSDYGPIPAGTANRIVNPYQACRSPFDLFGRAMPDATGLRWTYAFSLQSSVSSPTMEGYRYGYGAKNRIFGPGHMYLTCRLDGPKTLGHSAVFAVRRMLERSRRASSAAFGVNPMQAAIVLDDSPYDAAAGMSNVDYGRVFNLHASNTYWEYAEGTNMPPDVWLAHNSDDYVSAYEQTTGVLFDYSKVLSGCAFAAAGEVPVWLDYRAGSCIGQQLLNELGQTFVGRTPEQGVIAFCSFGRNGDDGKPKDYLYSRGDNGGVLFRVLNGAIFTSLESFNAVTMYSDQSTSQAKIIDFIDIGGSGAIGHSFEPQADAAVDNEFLLYNFLADRDGDLKADVCFAEAAWSGIPYLSWAEVVIGDPLMRPVRGPGEAQAWTALQGDVNGDRRVNIIDIAKVQMGNGGMLYSSDEAVRSKYNDLCDLNSDGRVNIVDISIVKQLNGTTYY